jgi:hypothetical protein
MAVTNYYGQGNTRRTVLEIFSEGADKSKVTHRRLEDQEAYDTYHLAFYFKELIKYYELLEKGVSTLDAVPRKDRNVILYLLLTLLPPGQTIVEVGSTLFELIEGLLAVRDYARRTGKLPQLDVEKYRYLGIELSPILRRASKILHPAYQIELVNDITQFKQDSDVLYDRSVLNYALDTGAEVAQFLNKFKVSFINDYFSKGETFKTARLGKQVTYFSLKEVCASLNKPMFHLYGERAPGPASGEDISLGRDVIEGFFLVADPSLVDQLIKAADQDPAMNAFFAEKKIKPVKAEQLL